MIPARLTLIFAAAALAATGLAVTACNPSGGQTSAREAAPPPDDQTLKSIPLGAPPGAPIPIAASVANPFEGDATAVAQGKTLFGAMNCVYCHGAQGSGLIGPPLNGPGWRYGGTPAQIYNSIHDGRPGGMPAWGSSLPADHIWRLVAYIESLGGALPPGTPQMATRNAAQPSTTGPQVDGQVQTDTAHESLQAANRAKGGG